MSDFSQPTPVSDVLLAFPATVSHLMPSYDDIAEWAHSQEGRPWVEIQRDWFYSGLDGVKFYAKEGIDPEVAVRHLKAIQGSFEPKHEHKEAAVAYLLHLWFDKVTYKKAKAKA